MEIAYWLIGTLLALCVGSFLNVVIYRLPQQVMNPKPGLTLLLPRSHHTARPRCARSICCRCSAGCCYADAVATATTR